MFPSCCQIKSNTGNNECSYCIVFSNGDAMSGAKSVSNKEMESEDSWTFNFLDSNDSESDNPPPNPPPPSPFRTLHSHLTSTLPLLDHLTSFLYLHSHFMQILSLHGHLKSTLSLQTGTLFSLPRVTLPKSKTSIQHSGRAGLLILILILYVLVRTLPILY